VAGTSVVPTTTLAAQTANNTSAAYSFSTQTNGNVAAGNVSKTDVHSLLYAGANTKIYAHLLLWFGGSNHMSVGYNSDDANQVHAQITDMISRGIDGVVIDWYGPNNSIDDATALVMTEAESHPGFTFAIMIDQGAIEWYSCSGCSPQQALVYDLQYLQQHYFSSPAYLTLQGKPVVTNFNIDLSYSVDWNAASESLATPPVFLFQNNNGFTHVLSQGSYSWVMPTTTDYGIGYLSSFYNAGMSERNQQTIGASYKGFNDSLASWGSNRVMGQQCGQTWLRTFSEVNGLYNAGNQLPALQLVTWNDYEEGTEIESGINDCFGVSASASGNTLQWKITGDETTVDHYVAYVSADGQNLMPLGDAAPGTSSINLCSYSLPNGSYTAYVQAIGKPSITNQMSGAAQFTLNCGGSVNVGNLTLGTSPSSLSILSGGSANLTVTVTPTNGAFNNAVGLACSGLPDTLSCSFSPSSVTPGSESVSSVLTVSAVSVVSRDRHNRRPFAFTFFLGSLGLVGISLTGKLQRQRIVMMIGIGVITVLLAGTISCGGKTGNPVVVTNASANSYVVAVNGNSGAVQLSTTILVTLK